MRMDRINFKRDEDATDSSLLGFYNFPMLKSQSKTIRDVIVPNSSFHFTALVFNDSFKNRKSALECSQNELFHEGNRVHIDSCQGVLYVLDLIAAMREVYAQETILRW